MLVGTVIMDTQITVQDTLDMGHLINGMVITYFTTTGTETGGVGRTGTITGDNITTVLVQSTLMDMGPVVLGAVELIRVGVPMVPLL